MGLDWIAFCFGYEHHHPNALGSPILLTDDTENVRVRYECDAFGAVRIQAGSIGNECRFTGKEWDADVRLYHVGARYYDPYIGRFTTMDAAQHERNWYVYVKNTPLKFVDSADVTQQANEEKLEQFTDVAS